MSKADKIFVENMTDIMEQGFWDTGLDVRPHWEDVMIVKTIANAIFLFFIIFLLICFVGKALSHTYYI